MPSDARGSYFETQVLTAPPYKLHLMLLEGALRHGRRAAELFDLGHDAAASEALLRSQEIVAELIASLRPDVSPALVRKAAGVYIFVHRSLAMAHFQRDVANLRQAMDVLEVECETWRQLCQQLDGSRADAPASTTVRVPRPAFLDRPSSEPAAGLSFEA
jgi:flagellar protein FliS